MSQQILNLGLAPCGTGGDTFRVGFNKINENFTEVFARMGITDGSQAQPGQIGELKIAQGTLSGNVTGNQLLSPGIILTPGDWDLSGSAAVSAPSGFITPSIVTFQFATAVGVTFGPATKFGSFNIGPIGCQLPMATVQVNITTNTVIYANLSTNSATNTLNSSVSFYARRAR